AGAGGRGRAEIRTDLAFMSPVTQACDACVGTRYNPEALSYRLAGRTVAGVLALTAEEAVRDYDLPGLDRLGELGLGYLTLGRALTTLSGGERQRLKLRSEEHTSELQSRENLVCPLLLEKKKHT